MGLAIAQNIIEEHNGMISISDNPPHGPRDFAIDDAGRITGLF